MGTLTRLVDSPPARFLSRGCCWSARPIPTIRPRADRIGDALLPLDLASFALKQPRLPPIHNLAPDVLLEKLAADYVFALLTEAAVESLASENAARFAAMGSVHDNVSKKLEELRQDAHQARQTEITTELLDLVTGAEALHSAERRS